MFDKKVIVLVMVLVSLFAMSSVSAFDSNSTDDVITMESEDNSLQLSNDTQVIANENENNLTYSIENTSADEILTVENNDFENSQNSSLPNVLSVSAADVILASSKSFHAKTFTVGKYKGTFTASQIKSVMNAQDNGYMKEVIVKTGKYKVVKKTKYKTKTKTKTVCFGRGKYTYGFWIQEYTQKGWKLVKTWQKGRYYDSMYGTMYKKCYAKFKKTVKVKSGTKKVKYPVKMSLVSYYIDGYYPGDNHAALYLWYSKGIICEKSVYVY